MAARHDAAPPADATPCAVRLKRADGLEVEVQGSALFVHAMLEKVLTVLGVIQAPPPA